MWIENNGKECAEKHTRVCKITHSFTYPKMCCVMDEVEGNTSNMGDGYIGERLMTCGK